MRDIDDGGHRSDRERARRVQVAAAVMRAGVVGVAVQALDDRGLVRAESQLQAIGLRSCQHEPDRQKGTRHQ